MKITFIGYKDSGVNIFPDLAKALSSKISGLALNERFAALPEDLPFLALESSEESDFIFVFALLDDEVLAEKIKAELVEVEVKTETRILKAVEEESISDSDENRFLEEKEALVKKYADLIVSILFNENEFEPQDKDFNV